jgi:hypothetical protein
MKKKERIEELKIELERARKLLYGCTLRMSTQGYDGQHRQECLDFIGKEWWK